MPFTAPTSTNNKERGHLVSLQINDRTYLQAREAAKSLGVTLGHFNNLRSQRGDDFLQGHPLIAGRIFYCAHDVRRLAEERGR